MKADTLFGSLARSSMRLSTGLLLSLGLILLLVAANLRVVTLLFKSEQERASAHFSRVLDNVREQENFLQAIADRLAAPGDELARAPANLDQALLFSDAGMRVINVSESQFSLPFTVTVADGQAEQVLNSIMTMGRHFTSYYSWFWAQSNFLSPQTFVLSPDSAVSVAVPALGKFRNRSILTRDNFSAVSADIARQTMKVPPRLDTAGVHWTRPGSQAQDDERMQVVAYIVGALPARQIRQDTGMNHVVVASLFELGPLSQSALDSDLPFHGTFSLISPGGDALTGQLHGAVREPGLSWTANGLLISLADESIAHERWNAQYFVDYKGLAHWVALPVLRLLGLSALVLLCFRGLYHYYRTRVVMPARLAQEQLLESRAFSQAVIESAPAGLLVVRQADCQVLIENQRAIGSPSVSQALVKTLRKPGVSVQGESCLALEGRYYLVSYSSTRYQEQDVLLCAFSDVTEHQQRAVDLHRARRAADKANEAKTIFLATMSHEIRTPLYGVLGTLELLGRTVLDSRQQHYLATMQTSSSTVLQIISDVLDVAKIESGQLRLEPVTFSPLDLVEDTLAAHVAQARAKGLQIYACIDPDIPPRMSGDHGRIAQILNNLLSNAVKFTQIGRVVLRCGVLAQQGQDVTLQFQVTDTGIGITAEQQTHIFEPFYQAHTSNLISGTGLGLSICSRFVEMMGGQMTVVSEPGLGSSFSVSLPLTQADAGAEPASSMQLDAKQVYVRAPARELADNVCAWLNRWGANAAVVSARPEAMQRGALLVDVLGDPERPLNWVGKRLLCEHDGPELAQRTDAGFSVSAHRLRAIAAGVQLATAEGSAPGAQPLEASLPALNLRILVAEDNLINQAILKEQLEALGCSVVVAGNGHQALQIWDEERFDVVLSDVNMPVLNGYELAQAIRARDEGVPVIGITANAMHDEGERCQAAGMSAWMVKPLSLTDLFDALAGFARPGSDSNSTAVVAASVEPMIEQPTLELSPAMRKLFHSTMDRDIKAIRERVASGAQMETALLLHSVSGALSVVQAAGLSAVFGQLEHKVRGQALTAALATEIERALEQLAGLLETF